MTQTRAKQACDAKAMAVAEAVFEAVRPMAVILFGSRARGDYREDSDVDLLVVVRDDEDNGDWRGGFVETSAAAHQRAEAVYGSPMNVDLVTLTESQFVYCRRAKNHVAGQAVRDGVTVGASHLPGASQEPANWPDIQQRFIAATRNLATMTFLTDANGPIEDIGFHAQQAIENGLKAWISALDDEYRNTHDISALAGIVRRHSSEDVTAAAESLAWLTKYTAEYRYEGARVKLDDPRGLPETIGELVDAIADRIRAIAGDEPPRWTPEA